MRGKKELDKMIIEVRGDLIKRGIVKNKTDFANKMGSYTGVFASIQKKDGRNATVDMILRLFDTFGEYISPNTLFGFDTPSNNIMFLSEASAGASIPTEFERDLNSFRIPNLEGNLFAFEVKGDSMLPTIESGDMLICKKVEDKTQLKDNKIYVVSSQDGTNVKRLKINTKNERIIGITLISDNKLFQLIEVDFSTGLHAYPMLEFYHPIKRITDNGLI